MLRRLVCVEVSVQRLAARPPAYYNAAESLACPPVRKAPDEVRGGN